MKVIQPLLFKDSSVAVCHLVSTPLNISKLIRGNAKWNEQHWSAEPSAQASWCVYQGVGRFLCRDGAKAQYMEYLIKQNWYNFTTNMLKNCSGQGSLWMRLWPARVLCTVCSKVSHSLVLALCILSHSFLRTVCSNVSASLVFAMRILFCSCLCKVCSRVSDALSQALCNLSLAFLVDFTVSDCTALIRFTTFSRKLHSAFRLDRKTWSQRSNVFCLTGTAALHCGHTFVGGMLTANG